MSTAPRAGSPLDSQVFVVADSERGLRLDRFLSLRIPRMSRTSVQEAIADRVTISSGAAPKPSRCVFAGEVITIRPREIPRDVLRGPVPAVLEERDGWLVADKPAGLATTPSASRPGEDLATRTGLAPAHRLDRFTSGCVVMTWTPQAARHFERVFRERLAGKEYLAVVAGVPGQARFVIDAPLAPHEASRVPSCMRVAIQGDEPQHARTEAEVIAVSPDGETALVRARPVTGRRHQIRVHLAHAGHPILGDLLYGGDERDFVRFQLGQPLSARARAHGIEPGRHLLHAQRLIVPDLDGSQVIVESPLPDDFPRWAAELALP